VTSAGPYASLHLRQITTPAPHHSFFHSPDALPATQPTAWKHWRQYTECMYRNTHTHTHTCLTALYPGLPSWAGTRKAKLIWILLKQETLSGSGISWAICKSAPSSRQITMPAPHHSVFYRSDALPAAQPTASKHWRHNVCTEIERYLQWLSCVQKAAEKIVVQHSCQHEAADGHAGNGSQFTSQLIEFYQY